MENLPRSSCFQSRISKPRSLMSCLSFRIAKCDAIWFLLYFSNSDVDILLHIVRARSSCWPGRSRFSLRRIVSCGRDPFSVREIAYSPHHHAPKSSSYIVQDHQQERGSDVLFLFPRIAFELNPPESGTVRMPSAGVGETQIQNRSNPPEFCS